MLKIHSSKGRSFCNPCNRRIRLIMRGLFVGLFNFPHQLRFLKNKLARVCPRNSAAPDMHFTYILFVLESQRFNCVTSNFPLVISVGREGEDLEADILKLKQAGLAFMTMRWWHSGHTDLLLC